MELPKPLAFLLVIFWLNTCFASRPYNGRWKLLKRSSGVSAMHMALLPNSRVVTYDRTNVGPSNISLPNGKCIKFANQADCTAHSIEFDPSNRNVRPLTLLSDTWCSSGALSPDGVLVQSGGYNVGSKRVRYLNPWTNFKDWEEVRGGLISDRWYASNQILPNGKIIVVGGLSEFNYEFIPKKSASDYELYQLPFLNQTTFEIVKSPNNLYPFTHLCPDGHLFIFANDRAILLDYVTHQVIRNYPVIPGGVSRNYPSTGSSVLLPLKLSVNSTKTHDAEVFICGGTVPFSYQKAMAGTYLPATNTCGRLVITDSNPKWKMGEMPMNRTMSDMIMLPTGDVLIVNGAAKGSAGWGAAREPVFNPVLYQPDFSKFQELNPSQIPRMYHSTAHLLPDGRVLIGGSNTQKTYNFTSLFPTDLSLEAFSPPYLSSPKLRPRITYAKPGTILNYNQKFSVEFQMKVELGNVGKISVTMVAPSFTTHSFAMNQRLLVLGTERVRQGYSANHVVDVHAPPNAAVAPPGYYLLFVVRDGVPSRGMWVQMKS